MHSSDQIKMHAAAVIVMGLLFSLACGAAETSCQSLEKTALKAQVMAAMSGVSRALSVLDALKEKDATVAVTLLEAQLKSNLTIMYALAPELGSDRAMIEETLHAAEKYVSEHDLKVVKP